MVIFGHLLVSPGNSAKIATETSNLNMAIPWRNIFHGENQVLVCSYICFISKSTFLAISGQFPVFN